VFDEAQQHLVTDAIVVVNGRLESRDDRGTKLLVAEIMPWDAARATYRPALHIEVRAEEITEGWIESVDAILSSHRGDADVYLHVVKSDGSREATRSRRYRVAEGDAVLRGLVGEWPGLRVRWSREMA